MVDAALRALAEPTRRRILSLVWDAERAAGEIAAHFDVTRPAVSQHLGVLKQAGLVSERREGTKRMYRAHPEQLEAVRRAIEAFWDHGLARLKGAAEEDERARTRSRGRKKRRERMSQKPIERELRIDASPQTVFSLLTDADKLVTWWPRDAKTDPVASGQYRLEFDEKNVAVGEYIEVVPNERLVFTWSFVGQELPTTTVEFTLTPEGTGTLLRMVHKGLPGPAVEPHEQGWDLYLPRLGVAATGGTNPPVATMD